MPPLRLKLKPLLPKWLPKKLQELMDLPFWWIGPLDTKVMDPGNQEQTVAPASSNSKRIWLMSLAMLLMEPMIPVQHWLESPTTWIGSVTKKLSKLISPQCGNFRIFLSLRFYMKSGLVNLESAILTNSKALNFEFNAFLHFLKAETYHIHKS